MIKRMSIVRRRADVSDENFARLWLGEHAAVARLLPGLREYTVDLVQAGQEHPGFDGIATVRFDNHEAMSAAFGDPVLSHDLKATRDLFAASASAFVVDEHRVVVLDEAVA